MQGLPCVGDESINGCIADDQGIGSVRIERVIRIRGDAHRNGGIGAPSRKACSDINLHNIARVEYAHAGNAMHHFIVHADAGRCRESRSTCSMRISKEGWLCAVRNDGRAHQRIKLGRADASNNCCFSGFECSSHNNARAFDGGNLFSRTKVHSSAAA